MEQKNLKLAVLIDADNISYNYLNTLFDEVAKYGVAYVKRVFGDWSSSNLVNWKQKALEFSIIPVQQFCYTNGKNSTDSAMIIDAMDVLYADKVDGFCLVSSDSDFTRLASRLRESGKIVIGFGENKTPQSFRTACDKFICLDLIDKTTLTNKKDESSISNDDNKRDNAEKKLLTNVIPSEIIDVLKKIVEENSDDAEGWVFLSKVGKIVNRYRSDFDYRVYGAKSLSNLFEMLSEHFEMQTLKTSTSNIKHHIVRERRLES